MPRHKGTEAGLKKHRELYKRLAAECDIKLRVVLAGWTTDHYGAADVYVLDRPDRRRTGGNRIPDVEV